ncbi:expressed unknown protein [Seminavis robusta]|uniref:Peptidase C1A papain C-terminal domain-containing protein n=1 Tax=Seminavis robusta TaxID=568900 RepID=A0A9N8E9E8_9STRA|nr:expressed unknown protein [Seminavis robusta]|eukprot:Sro772_g200320.1 n/a (422) ;mRNA; r:39233-40498
MKKTYPHDDRSWVFMRTISNRPSRKSPSGLIYLFRQSRQSFTNAISSRRRQHSIIASMHVMAHIPSIAQTSSSESEVSELTEVTNQLLHKVASEEEESNHTDIETVPVSVDVHRQTTETCYAHACATAIRAARLSLGLTPKTHASWLTKIIKKFGCKGAYTKKVLQHFSKIEGFVCERLQGESEIKSALLKQRAVVAEFWLPKYLWRKFFDHFKKSPDAVLTKQDFRLWSLDRPTEPRYSQTIGVGHAIVITGFEDGENTIFRFKNSWGKDFGDSGYFRAEADAFPDGLRNCWSVDYPLENLSTKDVELYLLNALKPQSAVKVGITSRTITLLACNLVFKLVPVSENHCPQVLSIGECAAMAQIVSLLEGNESVHVIDGPSLKLGNSQHSFWLKRHHPKAKKTMREREMRNLEIAMKKISL